MAEPAPVDLGGEPTPGSPEWWASRPARPAEPRRGRPRRSFDQIVETALELVDEVGTDAFHMRLLAGRLNTSTPTLYRHVSGKEELMVYVVDRLLADVQAAEEEEAQPRNWQDAARQTAIRFQQTMSQHPNVLPLLVAQIPVGPSARAIREQSIATFLRFGLSPRLATRAYTTIAQFAIGFAVLEPGSPGPAEAAALREHYRHLDPERYPHTVAAADALTLVPLEDEFLDGLQIILDGIDRAHRRR
jgi:AcrR family transcriptional regulator